jgi:hypothetical protein
MREFSWRRLKAKAIRLFNGADAQNLSAACAKPDFEKFISCFFLNRSVHFETSVFLASSDSFQHYLTCTVVPAGIGTAVTLFFGLPVVTRSL